jgi:hypothetical protein
MLFLEQANDAGAEAFLLIADHYEGQDLFLQTGMNLLAF